MCLVEFTWRRTIDLRSAITSVFKINYRILVSSDPVDVILYGQSDAVFFQFLDVAVELQGACKAGDLGHFVGRHSGHCRCAVILFLLHFKEISGCSCYFSDQ